MDGTFQLGYTIDFTCIPFILWLVKNCILTVESQIAKYGSQKVHHKHGRKWDICNQLHFFLWTAGERRKKEHVKMVGLDFSIAVKNVLSICISIVILERLMNAFSFKTGIHLQLHKEKKDCGNGPYLGLKSRNAGSALWLCSSAVPA